LIEVDQVGSFPIFAGQTSLKFVRSNLISASQRPPFGSHLGHPSNFTFSFSVPSLLNSIPIRVQHLQTNLSWTRNTSTFSNLDPRNLKKIQVGPPKSPCFSLPKVGALEALVAAMEHPESTAELQFLGAAAISASLWRSERPGTRSVDFLSDIIEMIW
jgi:hypothetical protein